MLCFVRNRVKHPKTGTSPYHPFSGTTQRFKSLRVFGCASYALKLPKPSNFEPRSYEGVYLEALPHSTCLVMIQTENSYRLIESRHVNVDEEKFEAAEDILEMADDIRSD